jgi:hypothetical protein
MTVSMSVSQGLTARHRLPRPGGARPPSGRFVLRLPVGLHAALQSAARAAALSLNEYCVRRLATPGSGLTLDSDAAALVERAAEVTADALIGVVLYGSWARGEAAAGSDVDVLIVVERGLPLRRSLYRAWDQSPARWHGQPVDPHFVHPPAAGAGGGLWGEVATDGIVVFERGLGVSSILARTRRDIAAGRLVRRVMHGQPYWTAA